jgi:hypothetical protein
LVAAKQHSEAAQLAIESYLLYNIYMGRPRGMRNAAMINGRITTEQMGWLEKRADELDGNLSAALRQTITDAWALEQARYVYRGLRDAHPEFDIGGYDDDRGSWLIEMVLSDAFLDQDDLALRELEKKKGTDAD